MTGNSTIPTWAMWAVLTALLLARGVLAALETALQALSETRAKELAKTEGRAGLRLARMKGDPESTAAALRSGMVLMGFTAVAIAVMVPPRVLDYATMKASEWLPWLERGLPVLSALVVALLATLVDVVFRSAAVQRSEGVALGLSFFGALAYFTLGPLTRTLIVPVNLVLKPFGAKVSFQPPAPPLDELERQLIRKAQKAEVDKGAPALIRSIFQLSDKTCRDVMVPRTEVVLIEINTPIEPLLQLIAEENHSRLPVYREDVDHIMGILHVRDLVPLLQNPDLIAMQDLVRPAVFVPWVKPIGDLLREMQSQRIHMAVVVDEYGGFSGIVTLEDILREIVGDIGDEFEEEVKLFEKQADGSYLVDAGLPREEFARAFDFKFPEGDYETLGGYLSHLAGAIPEVGDRFTASGFSFFVHAKQGPRLDRVRVVKPRLVSRTSKAELEQVPIAPPRPSQG